jgi:hypothetical protein
VVDWTLQSAPPIILGEKQLYYLEVFRLVALAELLGNTNAIFNRNAMGLVNTASSEW